MDLEIKNLIENQGKAWEEFKKTNDARLAELEKKGSADALLLGNLDKINNVLDETKSRMDKIEAAVSRPDAGGDMEGKSGVESKAYSDAMHAYLTKGNTSAFEEKALSVSIDPDGGYLVTPAMSARINKIIFESSPLRQLATVETISTDSLDMIDDNNDFASGWINETGTRSETTTANIGKRNIPVHEVYARPKATQKILDDASIDVESWIAQKVADHLARKEATAFISGNGVGQPRGILTYAAGSTWGTVEQVNSGTSGSVTADGLVSLFYSLKEGYMRNASFLMNRSVVRAVRTLKDTTNQYVWQPGLQAGQPDLLLGVGLFMATDMPVAGADSLSVAVGDFKAAYTVVDRIGIRTLRDPYSEKPFVQFYTTKRVGGDVTNFEALKLLKLAS